MFLQIPYEEENPRVFGISVNLGNTSYYNPFLDIQNHFIVLNTNNHTMKKYMPILPKFPQFIGPWNPLYLGTYSGRRWAAHRYFLLPSFETMIDLHFFTSFKV